MQACLLAVVLFLAYPQSSESLAWILGRAPVLSAVFLMGFLRLFFSEMYKWSTYVGGAFLFAAMLFTYQQGVLLPVSMFLLAFLEKQKMKRTDMFRYAFILSVVAVVYIIVRKLITSEVVGVYEGSNLIAMNWPTLVANAFRILCRLVLNPADKTAFILYCCHISCTGNLYYFAHAKYTFKQKSTRIFYWNYFADYCPCCIPWSCC
jgi:hypothetical protein